MLLLNFGPGANIVWVTNSTRLCHVISEIFRWVDHSGNRYNRFYVMVSYTCTQLKKKKVKFQRLCRRANLNRGHSLKNPRTIHLSYLQVDECSWKKIDQVSSAGRDHCTSTAVLSACKARTSTRSFRFALFQYKYNIHLTFMNIGWYLARDMARGAHGWPSRHICRAAGEANIDEVNCAHRGPYALAKYQPIFTRARWVLLTYSSSEVRYIHFE